MSDYELRMNGLLEFETPKGATCSGCAQLAQGGLIGMYAVTCPCSSHVFYGAEGSAEMTAYRWNCRANKRSKEER